MFDFLDGPPTRLNGRLWCPCDGVDDLNVESYFEQHVDPEEVEEERRNFEEYEEEQFLLEELEYQRRNER